MRRFWQVDFHPKLPHTAVIEANPTWTFPPVERLAKCGTVVTRAYSEALRTGPPVEAKTSWGRFIFTPDAPPFAPSEFAATASLGDGEVHDVPPPPLSLLDLPDRERRLGLLDFLHGLLLHLAEVRGWDHRRFDQARETAIAGGLRYVLQSPLKTSPDRRHRAGVTLEVDGNGDAWLWLRVTDRVGEVVHTSDPLMTHLSTKSFNAARRSLRWSSPTTISVDAWPLDEPFGPKAGGLYTADIESRVDSRLR